MAREYAAAVEALNTLQSNYATLKTIRDSGHYGANAQAIPEMLDWCRRLGYEPSDLNALNIIHVSGTKGKGSTSAFISSILSQYPTLRATDSERTPKIGLYTSPHLRTVRERIRLNNEPLSPTLFTKYFFETWDRIESSTHESDLLAPPHEKSKPNYFRFLTLTAFHAFMQERVDVAIMECGMGGEYDSTNIVPSPCITAITSLGMDHLDQLGRTIDSIAWHKSGIFKRDSPSSAVYSAAGQPDSALQVIKDRAAEKEKQLQVVDVHPQIASGEAPVNLEGSFQRLNASVACRVAAAWLQQRNVPFPDQDDALLRPGAVHALPARFKAGLAAAKWQGRCETRIDKSGNVTWYIDGGHTQESIRPIITWFSSHVRSDHAPDGARVLLFNQQTRDAHVLLRSLYAALSEALPSSARPFTHAIFSTNTPYGPNSTKVSRDASLMNMTADTTAVDALSVQGGLAETMNTLDPDCETNVLGNLEDAVGLVRRIAGEEKRVPVLVTGSLHLVGGVTEVLEEEEEECRMEQAVK